MPLALIASRNPAAVASRLTRDLSAGDVVLLHDGMSRNRPQREPVVLQALPRVLDAIEAAGLRATPLMDDPAESARV